MSGGVMMLAGPLGDLMFLAGCANAERATRTEATPRQLAHRVPMGRLGRPITFLVDLCLSAPPPYSSFTRLSCRSTGAEV